MAKVLSEHKAALMAAGQWPDFVMRRDGLIVLGKTRPAANREAVAAFLGEEAAARYGSARKEAAPPAEKKPRQKAEKETPPAVPAFTPPPVVDTPAPGFASLADFGDRQASEVDTIRWVARYMDILDVTPSDCPDPAAWSLLNACRKSPAFTIEFWRSMYTKIIPSRAQLGTDDLGGAVDGADQMETIEKILKLSAKAVAESRGSAEAARRVHCPEAAGSSPAPASSQGVAQ